MLYYKRILSFALIAFSVYAYGIFDKDVVTGAGAEKDQEFTKRTDGQEPAFVPLAEEHKRQNEYGIEPDEREIDYNKSYDAGKNEQLYSEKTYNRERYKASNFGRSDNRLGVPYFQDER